MPNPDNASDPFYMLYDVGAGCQDDIEGIIPKTQAIDLMVLSHNDADHISNADDILAEYEVKKVIWSGFERPGTATWEDVNTAINIESHAEVISLADTTIPIGSTWLYGETYITFVMGYEVPPSDWGFSSSDHSEYRNAGSIVMRVVYEGASILLVGDMIERLETATFPEDSVVAAEAEAIRNSGAVPIDSDVLVASHHGGNDASSTPFIEAVSPEYVIFPAGTRDNFGHPRATTAQRFLDSGVLIQNIFRTDRDDDENNDKHWEPYGDTGINDPSGDDSIRITISDSGTITVTYI